MGTPWLILPTFDEAENVETIVRAADSVLATASPDGHRILVVDDGSPDGTGEIADRLAGELASLEVLHRTERQGLGPAYLAGFAHALSRGARRVRRRRGADRLPRPAAGPLEDVVADRGRGDGPRAAAAQARSLRAFGASRGSSQLTRAPMPTGMDANQLALVQGVRDT